MAQKNQPRKGDWYSDVKKHLIEFEINMSEETIKNMPELQFKSLVKKQAMKATVNYLKQKQSKCEKGSEIKYDKLEIQDYLSPSANITLEKQQQIFSLRCKMNPLKENFSRNEQIKETYCIKECQQKIDNEHLTWCDKLNRKNDFRYSHLLNGNLIQKIKTLEQITSNEKRRMEENSTLVIQ